MGHLAAEALLATVTETPGDYSEEFVKELKTFYAELKDFFNAESLTEQLEGLRPFIDEDTQAIIDHFLWKKDSLEKASGANIIKTFLDTMHALTNLLATIVKALDSGIRNEDSNESESAGGAEWLVEEVGNGKVEQWTPSLTGLALGVQQLGLSGMHNAECLAIKSELLAWSSPTVISTFETKDTKTWALRLKAPIGRARRFAETYTGTVLQVYPGYVGRLGKAFRISGNTVRNYAEAEVRASVMFQVEKLFLRLLKAIRITVGEDGFDVIMTGRAVGRLIEVDKIVPGSLPSSDSGPVILLVKKAFGGEEIKAAVGCHVLAVLSDQTKTVRDDRGVPATVCVPRGKVIPFGAMEDALESSASLEKFHELVEKLEATPLEGAELDNVCNDLRSLVAKQKISEAVLEGLASGGFLKSARLIVRSSTNVGDLAGMSGSGL
ncbi:phosphoglucan, water dikinase, chloroplastic [Physcomitrium patens]|uniref:phosphoglucan, water dikinase, chloroplastic n=1 Tax=Physcomitrium patens TaxID=3218 RepID=UPI003CCE52EF